MLPTGEKADQTKKKKTTGGNWDYAQGDYSKKGEVF